MLKVSKMIVVVVLLLPLLLLTSSVSTQGQAVPNALTVPDGQMVLLKAAAKGVQVYICKVDAQDATKFAWTFKAPDATLYDGSGNEIGTHYAGPSWENLDGSKVVAAAQQRANVDPTAIPWLLLKATSNTGSGLFGNVTYIQRLDTMGGLAPTTGCDKDHVSVEQRIDYAANYVFYIATPSNIQVPDGQTLLLKAAAKGVQVYICKVDAQDTTKFAWTLKAPDATLYDGHGNKIGTHYAGPSWESLEGSKVVAAVQQRANVDPATIPWLLLNATSNTGSGLFGNVTYIQRLDTVGGLAPASGCDKDHVNAEQRIDYAANYYFFSATPSATMAATASPTLDAKP